MLVFVIGTGCQATLPSTSSSAAPFTSWQVCFSPRGGCTQLVTDTIAQARSEILVQAYSFTSEPIAQALVAAHQRGVKIEAILDKSQKTEDDSRAKLLIDSGIPVRIDQNKRTLNPVAYSADPKQATPDPASLGHDADAYLWQDEPIGQSQVYPTNFGVIGQVYSSTFHISPAQDERW